MRPRSLARQFELSHQITHARHQGISPRDNQVHPAPSGSCLNRRGPGKAGAIA